MGFNSMLSSRKGMWKHSNRMAIEDEKGLKESWKGWEEKEQNTTGEKKEEWKNDRGKTTERRGEVVRKRGKRCWKLLGTARDLDYLADSSE